MKLIMIAALMMYQNVFSQTLEEALKREISYVNLQTESLKKDQRQIKADFETKKRKLELEIQKLESEFVQVSSQNDQLQEQFSRLDRKKKDFFKKTDQLAQLYSSALNELESFEQELVFEKKQKISMIDVSEIRIHQFASLANKSLEFLQSASSVETIQAQYRNDQGELASDRITRVGRIGAYISQDQKNQVLGPSVEGLLKPVSASFSNSQPLKLYLFESVFDKIDLKVTASFWDRFADQLPLIILGLILSLCAYLFTLFARDSA